MTSDSGSDPESRGTVTAADGRGESLEASMAGYFNSYTRADTEADRSARLVHNEVRNP